MYRVRWGVKVKGGRGAHHRGVLCLSPSSKFDTDRGLSYSINVCPRVQPPYPSAIGVSSASRFLPPLRSLISRTVTRNPPAGLRTCQNTCSRPRMRNGNSRTSNHIRGITDFHVMVEATRDDALVDIEVRRRSV